MGRLGWLNMMDGMRNLMPPPCRTRRRDSIWMRTGKGDVRDIKLHDFTATDHRQCTDDTESGTEQAVILTRDDWYSAPYRFLGNHIPSCLYRNFAKYFFSSLEFKYSPHARAALPNERLSASVMVIVNASLGDKIYYRSAGSLWPSTVPFP